MKYFLQSPLCAIRHETELLEHLPEGSIIVLAGPSQRKGMMDVVLNGSVYSVFAADFEERARRQAEANSAAAG